MILLVIALVVITTPQQPLLCAGEPYIIDSNLTYMWKADFWAKPGCSDHCGEVLIPYPFGMRGSNCYYNESYEIICNTSFDPPRPFLKILDLEVMGLAYLPDGYEDITSAQVVAVGMRQPNVCPTGFAHSLDLRNSSFRYSTTDNAFVVQGCSGVMMLNRTGHVLATCTPTCTHLNSSSYEQRDLVGNSSSSCYDEIRCCSTFVTATYDLDFYKINVTENNGSSHDCNTTAAFIDGWQDSRYIMENHSHKPATILRWKTPEALLDYGDHANFSCYEDKYGFHLCGCKPPHVGNPYLPNGCRVDCSLYGGYHHCKMHHLFKLTIILGLSIGIGLVFLFFCGYWLYKFVRRTIEIKQKSKNFKRNGGLLLQQQISTTNGVVDKAKIITLIELNKATNNFNENRILGEGGQGTVYKGMMEDGKIVAIKKSKKLDEDQLEQFINEVVIVSQINHRNVVKLLGCCLETEVPLLVYEFIPNGTLYHHIHSTSEEFQLTWQMRLQIATESALALAHLHSSTSPPIYHRDIKSSNILLDDKYRVKVSDFGTSKAINIDQTHVTTCIKGTYGYLDPEYFQSNQFTEKSDVYSFGVVLVELITGKKPVFSTKTDGQWTSLAIEFIYHMESCTLDDLLDTRVLEEGKKEEMVAVAKVAKKCLKRNGKRRPTMKEVAKMLDDIRLPHQTKLTQLNYIETQAIQKMNKINNLSFPTIEMENCSFIDVQHHMVCTF